MMGPSVNRSRHSRSLSPQSRQPRLKDSVSRPRPSLPLAKQGSIAHRKSLNSNDIIQYHSHNYFDWDQAHPLSPGHVQHPSREMGYRYSHDFPMDPRSEESMMKFVHRGNVYYQDLRPDMAPRAAGGMAVASPTQMHPSDHPMPTSYRHHAPEDSYGTQPIVESASDRRRFDGMEYLPEERRPYRSYNPISPSQDSRFYERTCPPKHSLPYHHQEDEYYHNYIARSFHDPPPFNDYQRYSPSRYNVGRSSRKIDAHASDISYLNRWNRYTVDDRGTGRYREPSRGSRIPSPGALVERRGRSRESRTRHIPSNQRLPHQNSSTNRGRQSYSNGRLPRCGSPSRANDQGPRRDASARQAMSNRREDESNSRRRVSIHDRISLTNDRRRDRIEEVTKSRDSRTTLFVGNVPYEYTVQDIEGMFAGYGELKVVMPIDHERNHNKGFSFVTFETVNLAQSAYRKFSTFFLNGRKLRLDWESGVNRQRSSMMQDKRRPKTRARSVSRTVSLRPIKQVKQKQSEPSVETSQLAQCEQPAPVLQLIQPIPPPPPPVTPKESGKKVYEDDQKA